MGGTEDALLDVFNKAVVDGSIKFSSALHCNDPFEFKFQSVKPSRDDFDQWHKIYDPDRSPEELENAWASFSGASADYNTNFSPRAQLLSQVYILCLARNWNSHLMWAHYASSHTGFVVCYKQSIVEVLQGKQSWQASGEVRYSNEVPELRWFTGSQAAMLGPLLTTKSAEWSYEEEYRVINDGPAGGSAIFESVETHHIAGVILGARASSALEEKARALQKIRNRFSVERVAAESGKYTLTTYPAEKNMRRFTEFL